VTTLALFTLREAVRRRVFVVVAALTVAFLVLYALGVKQAFETASGFGFQGVDPDTVIGSTMLGLAMFATLFLGVVLAIFLTLGAVRGDAERGLLQPIVVRPNRREQVYLARLLAAAGVSAIYTFVVYLISVAITSSVGGWSPGDVVEPGIALALGVVIVCAISLAGSVLLASTANGIAVFMAFGAGLVAGLLGQIGRAINNDTLTNVGDVTAYVLPFEALYQHALFVTSTSGTSGFTTFVLQLGPLGGARDGGTWLWPFALGYLVLVVALGIAAFRRRDL
jgi:Cu-processing system permease protein